ncbi:MAG: signal peptidase I [Succinivibrionaceae bacterium]
MNTVTLILVVFTLVSGAIWFVDLFILRPKRKQFLIQKEKESLVPLTRKEKNEILELSGILGSISSCFPVLLIVFLVRAFAFEPFRIPSASMMPTLLRGDFILVEKFKYGIRNPFTNEVIIEKDKPERGDVVVFKYPKEPTIDYVKRVIGVPGDTILVSRDKLFIKRKNDNEIQLIANEIDGKQLYTEFNKDFPSEYGIISVENLFGVKHKIMHDSTVRSMESFFIQNGFDYGEWVVPESSYFVMGDNRDHSKDSRYWGFVPDRYLVGKVVNIWFSFSWESGFRYNRIGGIE